jgi:CubicO group peptidase (beta-lactamase class C family)
LRALEQIHDWGAAHAGIGVTDPERTIDTEGETDLVLRIASVTKLLTALAALVAVEEGSITLDDPAGPPGSTVRHLLAHASGLPFEGDTPIAGVGLRRIYSNSGFDALAAHVEQATTIPFADYLAEAVCTPLGMASTTLRGSPAKDVHSTVADLLLLARELLEPTLVSSATLAEATSPVFPDLDGVLPGVGPQKPMAWGLGFEIKDAKSPHWTAPSGSRRTFGHFGGTGTFLWVDPDARIACACLTDREFDDWALEAWPRISEAVLTAH